MNTEPHNGKEFCTHVVSNNSTLTTIAWQGALPPIGEPGPEPLRPGLALGTGRRGSRIRIHGGNLGGLHNGVKRACRARYEFAMPIVRLELRDALLKLANPVLVLRRAIEQTPITTMREQRREVFFVRAERLCLGLFPRLHIAHQGRALPRRPDPKQGRGCRCNEQIHNVPVQASRAASGVGGMHGKIGEPGELKRQAYSTHCQRTLAVAPGRDDGTCPGLAPGGPRAPGPPRAPDGALARVLLAMLQGLGRGGCCSLFCLFVDDRDTDGPLTQTPCAATSNELVLWDRVELAVNDPQGMPGKRRSKSPAPGRAQHVRRPQPHTPGKGQSPRSEDLGLTIAAFASAYLVALPVSHWLAYKACFALASVVSLNLEPAGASPEHILAAILYCALILAPNAVYAVRKGSWTVWITNSASTTVRAPVSTCSRFIRDPRNLDYYEQKVVSTQVHADPFDPSKSLYTLSGRWFGAPFVKTFSMEPKPDGGFHSIMVERSAARWVPEALRTLGSGGFVLRSLQGKDESSRGPLVRVTHYERFGWPCLFPLAVIPMRTLFYKWQQRSMVVEMQAVKALMELLFLEECRQARAKHVTYSGEFVSNHADWLRGKYRVGSFLQEAVLPGCASTGPRGVHKADRDSSDE